jgi:putative transcriptional regulator
MSKSGTTRIFVRPGEMPPPGDTDWERLDAMTDDEVIAAALSDPDAQPLTDEQLARMKRVSRVKVIRRRLGMTQQEFADAFDIPVARSVFW